MDGGTKGPASFFGIEVEEWASGGMLCVGKALAVFAGLRSLACFDNI
jgi:hypothetical protein